MSSAEHGMECHEGKCGRRGATELLRTIEEGCRLCRMRAKYRYLGDWNTVLYVYQAERLGSSERLAAMQVHVPALNIR